MEDKPEIPDYLTSTIVMIQSAYPSGIPDDVYFPLIRIMTNSGMSNRSVAHVMSILRGGTYVDHMYNVAHLTPNMDVDESTISEITNNLKQFGFDSWLNED